MSLWPFQKREATEARLRRTSGAPQRSSTPPAEVTAPRASLPPTRATGPIDPILSATVVLLIAFGVVMVFSASAVFAEEEYGDGMRFLVRQSVFAAVAIPAMLVVAHIDYRRWRPLTYPALVGTVVLLVLTLIIGRTAGGATRWIRLGPVDIQGAELAKLALVLFLAHSLSKKADRLTTFSIGVLPHLVVLGVLAFLCLLQPDLGSAMMLGLLTLVMLFAAGAKIGPILGTIAGGAAAAGLAIATSSFRRARVEAFLDPFGHREGAGYQTVESMLAFGSGGWTGVGLGDSRQKLFFLPEAHTDFISAIVGEELGFVGVVLLVGAFVLIAARGLRAALHAPDDYGSWLALGATGLVVLSALTNLAVCMGLVPTKGLVLPFVSYGGSALLVSAIAMGLVLNVSRSREPATEKEIEGQRAGKSEPPAKPDLRTPISAEPKAGQLSAGPKRNGGRKAVARPSLAGGVT